MRWCYKTVHYDLKKEGFLGSSFLDEAEVEQSLNEYGQAGWELISVTETQDGLIAIFKQPLDPLIDGVTVEQVTTEDEPQKHEADTEAIITEKDIIEERNDSENDSSDDDLYRIRIE